MSIRPLLLALVLSACSLNLRAGSGDVAAAPSRPPPRRPIRGPSLTVPVLTGLTPREAMDRLSALGHHGMRATDDTDASRCTAEAEPGRVCGSAPAAGTEIEDYRSLTLYVTPGPSKRAAAAR